MQRTPEELRHEADREDCMAQTLRAHRSALENEANQHEQNARRLRRDAEELERKPEPRPYYYGQEIGSVDDDEISYRALAEVGDRVFSLYKYGDGRIYSSHDYKCDMTHLDGTPLGEFRMVRGDFDAWAHKESINRKLLRWREEL